MKGDGNCLYSGTAYALTGIVSKTPSADKLSANGQNLRLKVAEWVNQHRATKVHDSTIELSLRAELQDDPHISASAKWKTIINYMQKKKNTMPLAWPCTQSNSSSSAR